MVYCQKGQIMTDVNATLCVNPPHEPVIQCHQHRRFDFQLYQPNFADALSTIRGAALCAADLKDSCSCWIRLRPAPVGVLRARQPPVTAPEHTRHHVGARSDQPRCWTLAAQDGSQHPGDPWRLERKASRRDQGRGQSLSFRQRFVSKQPESKSAT
jgi:hypothetical protein